MVRALLLSLLLPLLLFGAVADIVRIEGEATETSPEGTVHPLALHAKVEEGSRIVTAAGAKVKLRFDDGTLITVGPRSTFVVERFDDDPSHSAADFSLLRGTFKTLTGQIGKIAPERFKIRTPNAAIGIRGTHFAAEYRDGRLDVLYLGLGKGVIVSNDWGTALLERPGDGIFLVHDHRPRTERWDEDAVRALLTKVSMGDEEVRPDTPDGVRLDGSLRYLYGGADPGNGGTQEHHDAVLILDASSPVWNGLQVNASYYYRNSFYDVGMEVNDTSVLANADIAYRNRWIKVALGRQEIRTPLLAVAPIRPDFAPLGFAAWDKRAAVEDWKWELPLNVEAAYVKVDSAPGLRLHAAYIHGVRTTRSNVFVNPADPVYGTGIANESNSTTMLLYGVQGMLNDRWKVEYWGTYLADLYVKNYVELTYRRGLKDGALLMQGQYLAFNGTGAVREKIDLALAGLRIGGEYGGATVSLSRTQTSKTDAGHYPCIATPFNDDIAFTNTFASLNAIPPSGCGAPYGSDTAATLLYAGYDFNRIGITGLEGFVDYGVYDRGGMPKRAAAFDADLGYGLPWHRNVRLDLKYSRLDNADFIGADARFIRVMAIYDFP